MHAYDKATTVLGSSKFPSQTANYTWRNNRMQNLIRNTSESWLLQYDPRAYHHIAAFNGVIEPQQDGCLHWHIMIYSSVLSPELLEKAAAASSMALKSHIGKMLDSITCTTVPCHIHQWYKNILFSIAHVSKHPWGADIDVPNASSNYDYFISIGMKKSILTGMHGHGFCCEKGKRGKVGNTCVV
jgi:hypothetical protein